MRKCRVCRNRGGPLYLEGHPLPDNLCADHYAALQAHPTGSRVLEALKQGEKGRADHAFLDWVREMLAKGS